MTAVITSIERRDNTPRYRIYLDGRFAFEVQEDVLIRLRLRKGRMLDAAEIAAIAEEEERERAYVEAVKWLGAKARTSREILERLRRRGFAEAAARAALERLERERYIDDAAFAERWALERAHVRKKGKRLIAQELGAKGVAPAHIRAALGRIGEDEEWETALALARRQWRSVAAPAEAARQMRRIYGFLLRRGFPPELAERAVRAAAAEQKPEEPE
jgi:regulatory protein